MAVPRRAAALLGCVATLADPAGATEGTIQVGGRAGVQSLPERGAGPAVGAAGSYALGDMFDARLEVLAARHGLPTGTDLVTAQLGLAYKLDVFEWVPWVAGLAGAGLFLGEPGGAGERGVDPVMTLQLGVDYLVTRDLALLAEIRMGGAVAASLDLPIVAGTLGAAFRSGW